MVFLFTHSLLYLGISDLCYKKCHIKCNEKNVFFVFIVKVFLSDFIKIINISITGNLMSHSVFKYQLFFDE